MEKSNEWRQLAASSWGSDTNRDAEETKELDAVSKQ